MRHTARGWVLSACLIAGGCATLAGESAKNAAEKAPGPAISSSLEAVNEPRNRELLGQLIEMPEVQEAARRFAQGLTEGALAGLSDQDQQAYLHKLSQQFVGSLMAAAAQGIRTQLGPAFRDMLVNDVGPTLRDMLSDPSGASLEQASRSFARGVVLGMDDALTTLDKKQATGQRNSLLGRLTGAANTGIQLTTVVAGALGLIALALALWIARLMRQTHREQAESHRREASLTVLSEALRTAEGRPWSPELQEILRAQVHDEDIGPYFRDLLRQRQPPNQTHH